MKKTLLVLLAVALVGGSAYAGSRTMATYTGNYSGMITGSNQVVAANPSVLYNISLVATSGTCTVAVWDQASGAASGNPIFELQAAVNTGSSVNFSAPIELDKGILVTVTSGGAAFLNYETSNH